MVSDVVSITLAGILFLDTVYGRMVYIDGRDENAVRASAGPG